MSRGHCEAFTGYSPGAQKFTSFSAGAEEATASSPGAEKFTGYDAGVDVCRPVTVTPTRAATHFTHKPVLLRPGLLHPKLIKHAKIPHVVPR